MKYINHLNAVIAIVGLVIIAQTLGRTFWDGAPATPRSIDVPSARARVLSSPQPATPARMAPVFPPAAQPSRVADVLEDDSAEQVMPSPGLAAQEAPALPNARGIRSNRGLEGDERTDRGGVISVPGADERGRTQGGSQTPSFPGQFGQRPLPRDSRGPGYVPAPFNDGAVKRQPGEGVPSSPPVRSSLPEQRVR